MRKFYPKLFALIHGFMAFLCGVWALTKCIHAAITGRWFVRGFEGSFFLHSNNPFIFSSGFIGHLLIGTFLLGAGAIIIKKYLSRK